MWYDVLVLAILIVAMVRGAVRGVVWQLAGIAGIILCLVFAETISAVGSPYVSLDPPLNQWVVMFGGYLFFSFLSFGVARMLNGAIEKAQLKEYNKHLGALFGLLKGAALCLVMTFFLVTLSERTRDMLSTSKSARYAALVMDRMHPVMPDKLRGALATYLRELNADDLDLKYVQQDGTGPLKTESPTSDSPTWDPLAGSGDPSPTDRESVDDLLKQIPGLANDYVRDGVRQVYEAIPQENRDRFLQELQNAGPNFVFSVLQRWQTQPPVDETGSTQNVGYTKPALETRESLSAAISILLAPSVREQPAYEQSITTGLSGLPDAVSLGVLKDWQADLSNGDVDDPDPQTTTATSLDQRIIRQLTIQRVSVYQLSQALRERLMQARQ